MFHFVGYGDKSSDVFWCIIQMQSRAIHTLAPDSCYLLSLKTLRRSLLMCEWLYHVQSATEEYASHCSTMRASFRVKERAREREKRLDIQIVILH